MRASSPHEMKSSTSQRAGSSRTFLKTMYLTSGAYVMTSRLRACTSPVSLYAFQSASAASGEILFLLDVALVMVSLVLLGGVLRCGRWWYRLRVETPTSPIRGNR